jgi:hypothetical protein
MLDVPRTLGAFLVLLLIEGCNQPVRPVTAESLPPERVFSRNYSIGEQRTAYVGQSVVAFKDYRVSKRRGRFMRPSLSFRASQGIDTWHLVAAGKDYPVVGELDRDGVTYQLVEIDTIGCSLKILVDPNGRPYRKMMCNQVLVVGTSQFEPEGAVFAFSPGEVIVDKTAGFINFELVYGGTDGKAFTLTYREYTPEDLVKAAFTQVLTYENRATQIRFRNTRLFVHEINSESITYTVAADESQQQP